MITYPMYLAKKKENKLLFKLIYTCNCKDENSGTFSGSRIFSLLGIFIDSPFREQTRATTIITTKKEFCLFGFILLRTSQHLFQSCQDVSCVEPVAEDTLSFSREKCASLVRHKDATPDLKSSVLPLSHCAPRRSNNTPDRWLSKTLILSSIVDQKSSETEFSIAICRQSGDKWQSKTLFLAILNPCSSIHG